MSDLLADKTTVVTGGASGIGREMCRQFAEHGADVVIADIRENPRDADETTMDLLSDVDGTEYEFVQADVTKEADHERIMEAARNLGGLDVMVNNAAIIDSRIPVTEYDLEDFETIVDINYRGVFLGCQHAAREMSDNDGGSIINMSSIDAIRGPSGLAPYSGTKGAVMAFTYAFAAEVGPDGIRVNTIHPGATWTQMTVADSGGLGTETAEERKELVPLRRYAEPVDIANAAVFLASDLAGYVTAESIVVDGGFCNTS